MASKLGEKIKKIRLELGLSLEKLGEMTDSSKSYIWELENRDTRKPSAEKINKIAIALGVTTDYLVDNDASENEGVYKDAFFRKYDRLGTRDKNTVDKLIDLLSEDTDSEKK